MPRYRHLLNKGSTAEVKKKALNWFPGHMYSGMQAMIGKLYKCDIVFEVHDARIPFVGRNKEFKEQLGAIKPRILILNKSDLADLTRWDSIKKRLNENGDKHVMLTDLSGSDISHASRGYNRLLDTAVGLINESERHNREGKSEYMVMTVGIPNVGKSTLINRLCQYHLGRAGERAQSGAEAGLTKHVGTKIKISSRPLIYSLDTPGVLKPSATRNHEQIMQLGLCATIADRVLDPEALVTYLLKHLNQIGNLMYVDQLGLEGPVQDAESLHKAMTSKDAMSRALRPCTKKCQTIDSVSRWVIDEFRRGCYGKIMFS